MKKIFFKLVVIVLGLGFFLPLATSAEGQFIGCCAMAGGGCMDIANKTSIDFCLSAEGSKYTANTYCNKDECKPASAENPMPKLPEALSLNLNQPFGSYSQSAIKVDSDTLKNYLANIYNFALGIIGLVTLLMMTIGGVQWLMANGNSSKITSAKETIFGALIGLLLALGCYFILNNVMGDFTKYSLPYLPIHKSDTYSAIDFDLQSAGDAPGELVACNSGKNLRGEQAAQEVITYGSSMKGKVTYHLGGKNPYVACSSDQELPAIKTGQPCKKSCDRDPNMCWPGNGHPPIGQSCLDCSGFVGHVYNCATGTKIPSATSALKDWSGNDFIKKVSNIGDLEAGDIFGFAPAGGANGGNNGHVMIIYSRDNNQPIKKMHVGNNSCTPNGAMNIDNFYNNASVAKTCGSHTCFMFHLVKDNDYKIDCGSASTKPCGLRKTNPGKTCVYKTYKENIGQLSGGCYEK